MILFIYTTFEIEIRVLLGSYNEVSPLGLHYGDPIFWLFFLGTSPAVLYGRNRIHTKTNAH
uniref:Uncharacterized protein n=1 Tax=Picea sitchensis TaxID=3332 RepID=A0A6B9XQ70_PICSI|nr:hypothetical protein Q903MT_gene4223 [Picea sitchensis]